MNRKELIDAVKVKLEEISPFEEPESFIADGDDAAEVEKPIFSYIEKSLDEAAHNMLCALPLSLLHADIVRDKIAFSIDNNGVGIIPFTSSKRLVRFHQKALQRDITAFITTEDPLYLLQQDKYARGGTAKPVMVYAANSGGEGIEISQAEQGQLEIYSFPKSMWGQTLSVESDKGVLYYIPTDLHAGLPVITVNNVMYKYSGIAMSTHIAWVSDGNDTVFTQIGASAVGDDVYGAPASGAAVIGQVASASGDPSLPSVKSGIDEYIVLECAAMVSEILSDVQSAQAFRQQIQSKVDAQLK